MAAVQRDWGLYKKRRFLHRQAQSEEGVKGRGEKTAVYQPGREAWDGSCPHSPQGTNPGVLSPGSQASGLQHWETRSFCHWSHPACGAGQGNPGGLIQRCFPGHTSHRPPGRLDGNPAAFT